MEDAPPPKKAVQMISGYGEAIKDLVAYVPKDVPQSAEEYVALVSEKIMGKDKQGNLRPLGDLMLFLHQANRTGLDPLARQLTPVFRYSGSTGKDQMSIQTTIDGYRLIAERTGLYAGSDDIEYEMQGSKPTRASCTVYKLHPRTGERMPVTASAWWDEYAQERSPMWTKMPRHMLGKCAEALALRKAFPQELSGIYTKDEMREEPLEEMQPRERIQGALETYAVQVEEIEPKPIEEENINQQENE